MPTILANDDTLIKESINGSREAFNLIVDKYWKRCYWIAYGIVGNHEDACDVAQESFIKVWRALDSFDTRRPFYTWLYRIVVHASIDCTDHCKTMQKCKADTIKESVDPDDDTARAVYDTLARIPKKYKMVLMLRDIEGLSLDDIVNILGWSYNCVRWRLCQARRLFRREWMEKYGRP